MPTLRASESSELDSILTDLPPPTVGEERQDRKIQIEKLRALFTSKPLQDIEADELTRLVGPNYRSRIANLRYKDFGALNIVNVSRSIEDASGHKHKALGAYRLMTHTPLGRDAGTGVQAEEPTLFELTP